MAVAPGLASRTRINATQTNARKHNLFQPRLVTTTADRGNSSQEVGMFAIGLLTGICIGATLGVMLMAALVAGSQADERMERELAEIRRGNALRVE